MSIIQMEVRNSQFGQGVNSRTVKQVRLFAGDLSFYCDVTSEYTIKRAEALALKNGLILDRVDFVQESKGSATPGAVVDLSVVPDATPSITKVEIRDCFYGHGKDSRTVKQVCLFAGNLEFRCDVVSDRVIKCASGLASENNLTLIRTDLSIHEASSSFI